MIVGDVIAEILKRERVKTLFVYPLTPLTEFAAAADIRPIVVRQEASPAPWLTPAAVDSGGDVGVFACQGGRGIENSFGRWRRRSRKACHCVIIVPGPSRALANVPPSFERAR